MKNLTFIVLCFLWTSYQATATHNKAGEIIVKQLSDVTVEVFIITYSKQSSLPADRDTLTINWGDGNLELVGRVNGNGNGEPIGNDTKKNIYYKTHTYPATGTYTLSMTDLHRNHGILNINPPNSDNVPFHLETVFVMVAAGAGEYNQTPVLLESPIDIGFVNEPFVHVPNAFDLDGDSISYELIVPMADVNTDVPLYIPPNEIGQNNNTLTIDAETGKVTWDSPEIAGEYAIAILIKSYRNNVETDRMVRDMQIIIKDEMELAPEILFSGAQENVITPVSLGDTVKITFDITEPDAGQALEISSTCGLYDEYYNNPATFEYSVNGNSGTAAFEWVVKEEHLRDYSYELVVQGVGSPTDNGLAAFVVFRFNTTDYVSTYNAGSGSSVNINLYPNPTQDHLLITSDMAFPAEYTIVDLMGRKCKIGLLQFSGDGIDVRQMMNGWYSLQLVSAEGKRGAIPFLIQGH